MYLSKLELHGFKSFAAPTALRFDDGITAIVGPNGCGKSNIVDAVRWVIGEQRARILRSEKMENVIFNGTSSRRPLGLAEVQLTIENTRGVLPTEYSEVTIGRRLYRSGDSEYLLNGAPCRLKDIVDLFMDTGMGAGAYSVIELKMIEEILSDSAQDRRRLFEEAAGITKYKQRRRQALGKLDGTQADLSRLRDLTDEIDKRVRSLKRQAAKAERYRATETHLHTLELQLAQAEYDRLTERQALLATEMQGLDDELEAYTAQLSRQEADLAALRTRLVDREGALSERRQRLNAHLEQTRTLEADLRLEAERLDTARRDYERTTRAQQDDAARRTALQEQADALAQALVDAEPERRAAEEALDVAQTARDAARDEAERHHAAVRTLRRQETEAATTRTDAHRRLDRLVGRLDLLADEQTRLTEEAASLEASLRERAAAVEAAERERAETEAHLDAARTALEEAEQQRTDRQAALDDARAAVQTAERDRAGLEAEIQVLTSLTASYEGFSDAVQTLAEQDDWTDGPLVTVADVLRCAPAHRRALDAALGELAACVVVQTEAEAARAAQVLRRETAGRATLLVLDALRPLRAPDLEGAQPLSRHVAPTEDRFAPLIPALLGTSYLAETLAEARAQAATHAAPARFVTPHGTWADTRGWLRDGDAREATPVADRLDRQAQLETAQARLVELDERLDALHRAAADAATMLAAVPFDARRTALAEADRRHTQAHTHHARLAYDLETLRRRHADLAARLETLADELVTGRDDVATLTTAAEQADATLAARREELEAAEDAYRTAEAASRKAQETYAEAHVAAVQARNRRDNLQRDRDRTQQDIGALVQRAEDRTDHLDALQTTIDAAQTRRDTLHEQLASVRNERGALDEAVEEAQAALLHVKGEIDAVEGQLRTLRQEREQRMRDENARAVKQAEVQTRLEDLVTGIQDEFGRSLAEEPIDLPEAFEVEPARAEVQTLRASLRSMGSVNALALEEYAEEKERLDFLLDQQRDLEAAEATLLETIEEINTTAAERFETTYRAIERNFHELFGELFGQDATGHLELSDPSDPLESPIDIMAKPRGKRPVSISQLSSGEKTLTAIALLFAIYLVKPSPFCILDEVDAPLDDANIDRFMRLIRRFAADTQFILVTHNKRTMELADQLYGITMQEQGVSRLVGVRFDEALEVVES